MAVRWWWCLLLVAVSLVLVLPGAGAAEDGARAGMEAHVDPATGALVPEPVTPRPAEALPAPRPPVAEVPGPNGGMVVDLKDRFLSTVVATVHPDGSLRIDCVTGDAEPHR